jgi:hypothetical protein
MDANLIGSTFVLVASLAVVAIVFLIFRGLMLWYWKVNEILRLLQSIDAKIGK